MAFAKVDAVLNYKRNGYRVLRYEDRLDGVNAQALAFMDAHAGADLSQASEADYYDFFKGAEYFHVDGSDYSGTGEMPGDDESLQMAMDKAKAYQAFYDKYFNSDELSALIGQQHDLGTHDLGLARWQHQC